MVSVYFIFLFLGLLLLVSWRILKAQHKLNRHHNHTNIEITKNITRPSFRQTGRKKLRKYKIILDDPIRRQNPFVQHFWRVNLFSYMYECDFHEYMKK